VSDAASKTEGLRAVAEVEYGLTKNLTLAAGASQITQEDKDYRYLTGGMRTSFGGWLGSADIAYDPENSGSATRLSLASGFYDIDLRLQQTFFNDFISDENSTVTRLLRRRSQVEANTFFHHFIADPMTIGFSAIHSAYDNGDQETILRNNLSQSLWGLSITNNLERRIDSANQTTGDLALRGTIGKVLLGATIDYDLQPQFDMRQFDLSAQFYWSDRIINRFNFSSQASGDYRYTNTVSFDRDRYSLNLSLGNDQDNDYFIGVGLNSSFTRLPGGQWYFQGRSMAESGGAALRAFLDSNANGKREPDEAYLEDVSFRRGGAEVAMVNKQMGFTAPLPPDYPIRVAVDKERLGDPMRETLFDGYEILPRPGHTTLVDLPVIEVALVEGRVFTRREGAEHPANSLPVELLRKDGSAVTTTMSEFDGYYMFDRATPGTYLLRVQAPANSSLAGYKVEREVALKSGEFYTFDLELTREAGPGMAPAAIQLAAHTGAPAEMSIIHW
jgi:hypothetical protein